MPEAEDILFNTLPHESQSLAVTTLLDSAIADETILSVFPNGGYSLGNIDDAVFEKNLELERGFPVIKITDTVRKTEVAKILYRMNSASVVACQDNQNCTLDPHKVGISGKIILDNSEQYAVVTNGGKIIFTKNNAGIASIANDGSVELAPTTTLRAKEYATSDNFSYEIIDNGSVVGEVTYQYSGKSSVTSSMDSIFNDQVSHDAPIVQSV